MSFSRKQKTFSPGGACPETGCIQKKPNGKWGIISNKTGEFWDANYETEEDAKAGLAAYHANKHFSGEHYYVFVNDVGRVYLMNKGTVDWIREGGFKKAVPNYKAKHKIIKKYGPFKSKDEAEKFKNKLKKSNTYSEVNESEFYSMLEISELDKNFSDELTNNKNFSFLPIDEDPSILGRESKNKKSPDTEIKPQTEFKSWKVGSTFGMNIEPWLVAEALNSTNDGIYAGTLESDEIQIGDGEKIILNIKSNVGQPNDVLVYVKGNKIYIWKCEQIRSITKKYSSFDIQSNYSFDLMPTELKLDMEHLIGSWMLAASICHLYHICDENYAGHIALEEFYEKFPDKIDALAEHYLADNDRAKFRICIVPKRCPIDYLTRLLKFTKDYVEFHEAEIPSAYQSQIDDITNFTQGILYKLKRLDSGRRIFSESVMPNKEDFIKIEEQSGITNGAKGNTASSDYSNLRSKNDDQLKDIISKLSSILRDPTAPDRLGSDYAIKMIEYKVANKLLNKSWK